MVQDTCSSRASASSAPISSRWDAIDSVNARASAARSHMVSHRNVQRFRGGLVFKAHRLLYLRRGGRWSRRARMPPPALPPERAFIDYKSSMTTDEGCCSTRISVSLTHYTF